MSETQEPSLQTPRTVDVGTRRLAMIYAQALFNRASELNLLDAVREELRLVVEVVFDAFPHIERFISQPIVPRKQRLEIIQRVFGGRVSDLLLDFLMLLNRRDRHGLIRPIYLAYCDLLDDHAGRIRITVRTATPLAADQQERLRQQLQETLKLTPVLQTQVDPALLGGLVIRLKDRVFDGSVRDRLEKLKTQLLSRGTHEIQSRRDRFRSDD